MNVREYIHDRNFLNLVGRTSYSKNKFESREAKMKLLRAFGYNVLDGKKFKTKKGNEEISLHDCSTSKLTGALSEVVRLASKRVQEYELGIKSRDRYKSIEEALRSEENLSGEDLESTMERTAILLSDVTEEELEVLRTEYKGRLGGIYDRVA